tara:strand:+ start:280918 stop:282009 length:1092 start_codon:yes stop_codon:yes gene_type:complete
MAQILDRNNNSKSLVISQTSEAVNVIRGIMVMTLIFVHWSPGVFERLSIDYLYVTNPFFRIATPGFAIIFGLATGLYTFSKFKTDRQNALLRVRAGLKMVLGGVLILATIKFLDVKASGHSMDINWPVNMFFSVLLYYVLALSTMPIWYYFIARFKYMEVAAIIGSMLFFASAALVHKLLPSSEGLIGFVRLGGLMLEAKYNYFSMSGSVFMGIAFGLYIKRLIEKEQKADHLVIHGIFVILMGILASFALGESEMWFTTDMTTVWMNMTYFGVIILLFCFALRYGSLSVKSPLNGFLFRMMSVFGSISLRMFVGHGLVIPFKNLMVSVGIPYGLALSIAMALFVVAIAIPVKNNYKKYYGVN